MLEVQYDPEKRIVRVAGDGFYSLADEQAAAVAIRDSVARCRAENGDLKILVTCTSIVQDAQVMQSAAKRKSMTTESHDRVAFLFTTSLAKMQASRFFNSDKGQCFISEGAAMTWLLADRGEARVAA